ncbi:MAG: hypothetical protein U1F71_12490 [Verrucomicrobiaceae bacterium]
MMPHGKAFLYGLCGTVQGRLGWAHQEIQVVCRDLNSIMLSSQWLASADFDTIHYVMRFGAAAEDKILCRTRPKDQELEVTSQQAMADLHSVFLDRPKLRDFLAREVARVLIDVQSRFQLPLNQGLIDSVLSHTLSTAQQHS